MNIEALKSRIENVDLRPSEVVKMSYGLVSINQAQQWVDFHKTGRKLSAPVIVMLLKMCEDKERGVALMDGELTKERILAMAVPKSKQVLVGVYFLIHKNEIVYVGKSVNYISRLNTHKREDVKVFDKIFILEVDPERVLEIERHYIKKFNPVFNLGGNYKYDLKKAQELAAETKVKVVQENLQSKSDFSLPFKARKTSFRAHGEKTVKMVGDFWIFEHNGESWKVPKNLPYKSQYNLGGEIVLGESFSLK